MREARDVPFAARHCCGCGLPSPLGECLCAASTTVCVAIVDRGVRQQQAIVQRTSVPGCRPVARSAPLTEPGLADAARELLGSETTVLRISKGALPTAMVADLEAKTCQQNGIGARAEHAVALCEQIRNRHLRFERNRAEHWIIAVDRFQIDEGELAARRARHASHDGGGGHLAVCFEEGALLRGRFALISAKDASPPSRIRP